MKAKKILVCLSLVAAMSVTSAAANIGLTSGGLRADGTTSSPTTDITLDSSEFGTLTVADDGRQFWNGSYTTDEIRFAWDLTLDSDPLVTGAFSVTNLLGFSQFFQFQTAVPSTIAVPIGGVMKGSSSVTVADANGDAAASLSSLAGTAVYQGRIEGVTLADVPGAALFNPFSLTVNSIVGSDSRTAGFSGSTPVPVGIGKLVALRHSFLLSAGDSATVNSTFYVVPEPAGVALFLVGCLALGGMRKRS